MLALHPWEVAPHLHSILEDLAAHTLELTASISRKQAAVAWSSSVSSRLPTNIQKKGYRLPGCGRVYCRTRTSEGSGYGNRVEVA